MGFLDNSGDIILDAVLTDTGRWRLSRGNFKVSKFGLGDDEITQQDPTPAGVRIMIYRLCKHPS
jgi:hypothetical protein